MNRYLRSLILPFLAGLFALCAGAVMPAYGQVKMSIDMSVSVRPLHKVPPDPVTDLSAFSTDKPGEIYLTWTAPQTFSNVSIKNYYIRWSTLSVQEDFSGDTTNWWNEAPGGTVSDQYNFESKSGEAMNHTIEGLTGGVSYYFAIKAVDEFDNISDIDEKAGDSNQASAQALAEVIKPLSPAGVKIKEVDENKVVLRWRRVEINEDASAYLARSTYTVYRAVNDKTKKWEVVFSTPDTGSDKIIWTDTNTATGENVYYYKVTARSAAGHRSRPSMIVDTTGDRYVYAISEDGRAQIDIPKEINALLYAENNDYETDFIIRVSSLSSSQSGVVGKYNYRAIRADTAGVEESFIFERVQAEIKISYAGEAANSAHSSGDNYSLYWFNGIEWLNLGGKIDEFNSKVSILARSLGKYVLKSTSRSNNFEIISIQPDKIFTPRVSYTNFIEFKYVNPKEANVSGKIYDLRGAYVADMEKGGTGTIGDVSGSFIWDGKDSRGNYVSGGVYIYQIEVTGAESKIVNGTVVVGR